MWDPELCESMHWDVPDEAVTGEEKKFLKETFHGPLTLPYRLFVPRRTGEKVPLVLYLHGADDLGSDNRYHLLHHNSACVFALPSWQERHPAFVLAPHCPTLQAWRNPPMLDTLEALLEEICTKYSAVERKRLYVYGSSMGGVGTLELIRRNPRRFAGAIPICAATKDENLEDFFPTSLWLVHSEDDRIVKPGRFSGMDGKKYLGGIALSEALWKKGKATLSLTAYPEGSLMERYGIHPHCSWYPAMQNNAIKEWLFSCKKEYP